MRITADCGSWPGERPLRAPPDLDTTSEAAPAAHVTNKPDSRTSGGTLTFQHSTPPQLAGGPCGIAQPQRPRKTTGPDGPRHRGECQPLTCQPRRSPWRSNYLDLE